MPKLLHKIGCSLLAIAAASLILMAAIAALSARASAQISYGYNGTNVPENLTPYVIDLLDAQVPAGETFVLCFRNDKYTAAASDGDINNVITLRNKLVSSGKRFTLIYTLNARGAVTIEQNVYALNQFKDAGVNIMAVRLGNEEFFKEAGHASNWTTYINKNSELLSYIESQPDNYTVIFPIADPDWTLWNPAAIEFIAEKPTRCPDIHFYFDKKAVPVINTLVNKTLPAEKVTSTYLPGKDNFYKDLYDQVTSSQFYDQVIDFCRTSFPGKKIYITEYGPATGPGEIGGTLGYEATTDWFLNRSKADADIIAALCRFNGPSLTGVITPVSKNDAPNINGYIPRLAYFTISNFLQHRNATYLAPITSAGNYEFSFHNLTEEPVNIESLFQLPANLYIESYSFDGIQGQYFYSSSGACAWWSKGSDKTYEITGTKTSLEVPAKTFGYINVSVAEVKIYGCTDPEALNYNPLANSEDLSCYYQRDCSCGDRNALNYNANAICIDNTNCEYAPPPPAECLKQRWLFTSLGCKPSKKNCDCK